MQALEEQGGAQDVQAGGTFCAALTHGGSVVLWGTLAGNPESRQRGSPSTRVTKIENLPPIAAIAAGYSHAVMADRHRVWVMGR